MCVNYRYEHGQARYRKITVRNGTIRAPQLFNALNINRSSGALILTFICAVIAAARHEAVRLLPERLATDFAVTMEIGGFQNA